MHEAADWRKEKCLHWAVKHYPKNSKNIREVHFVLGISELHQNISVDLHSTLHLLTVFLFL